MMRLAIVRSTLALALLTIPTMPTWACPRCRDAVGNQTQNRLAEGFSYSIYLMIAVPVILAASGSVAVVRAARKGLLPEL